MNKELHRVHKELNIAAREIPKAVKGMDGWAKRIMNAIWGFHEEKQKPITNQMPF